MREMLNDTRGQSIGITRFFLSLIVAAAVGWIVREIVNPILAGTRSATTNPEANDATMWFQTLVDYLPVVFLLIAFFGLIVLSIYQREVLR